MARSKKYSSIIRSKKSRSLRSRSRRSKKASKKVVRRKRQVVRRLRGGSSMPSEADLPLFILGFVVGATGTLLTGVTYGLARLFAPIYCVVSEVVSPSGDPKKSFFGRVKSRLDSVVEKINAVTDKFISVFLNSSNNNQPTVDGEKLSECIKKILNTIHTSYGYYSGTTPGVQSNNYITMKKSNEKPEQYTVEDFKNNVEKLYSSYGIPYIESTLGYISEVETSVKGANVRYMSNNNRTMTEGIHEYLTVLLPNFICSLRLQRQTTGGFLPNSPVDIESLKRAFALLNMNEKEIIEQLEKDKSKQQQFITDLEALKALFQNASDLFQKASDSTDNTAEVNILRMICYVGACMEKSVVNKEDNAINWIEYNDECGKSNNSTKEIFIKYMNTIVPFMSVLILIGVMDKYKNSTLKQILEKVNGQTRNEKGVSSTLIDEFKNIKYDEFGINEKPILVKNCVDIINIKSDFLKNNVFTELNKLLNPN